MIKPLTDVTATAVGFEQPLQYHDSYMDGVGKTVYKALTHGEDSVVGGAVDGGRIEGVLPFHAVSLATVTHSSTEAEDPVDSLCVTEADDGILGKFLEFNSNITLPPLGTEWAVNFTVAQWDNFVSIKIAPAEWTEGMQGTPTLMFCPPEGTEMIGCLETYIEGHGWNVPYSTVIQITGGADADNPEFISWITENTTVCCNDCYPTDAWLINENPAIPPWEDPAIEMTGEPFTIGGVCTRPPYNHITIHADQISVLSEDSMYSMLYSQGEWAWGWEELGFNPRLICPAEPFTDPTLLAWLEANATKVS